MSYPYRYRRTNTWMWSKPCTCCRQFEIDQVKKMDTRAQRAAMPQNPPPETIQVTTVPVYYPTLETVIARLMNTHYGFTYNRAPAHDLYGCMIGHDGYNPWSSNRNWEE